VGQGDVTSASGNRNCYLEDFQTAKTNCTKNYAVGAYQETYYATPRPGWKFDHWVTYCANATPPNYDCSFNIPAATVQQYWGQTMPPLKAVFTTCTPGAPGCGWHAGDIFTRTQFAWDTTTSWFTAYDALYTSTFGTVEIGIPGTAGYSLRFSSELAVTDYFIQNGTPAALNADLDDTGSSSSGQFGGEVLALRLNVDFSAAGQMGGTSGLKLGSLTLCNMTDPSLNGKTVNGLLAIANTLLGGGSVGSYTISAIHDVVGELNFGFLDGTARAYAVAHVFNGACP